MRLICLVFSRNSEIRHFVSPLLAINTVHFTATFSYSLWKSTLWKYVHLDPWTQFTKNLKWRHFSLAEQYSYIQSSKFKILFSISYAFLCHYPDFLIASCGQHILHSWTGDVQSAVLYGLMYHSCLSLKGCYFLSHCRQFFFLKIRLLRNDKNFKF